MTDPTPDEVRRRQSTVRAQLRALGVDVALAEAARTETESVAEVARRLGAIQAEIVAVRGDGWT